MTGRGEGPGTTGDSGTGSLQQIEYLLYQSCQGIHFIFDNSEIASILRKPAADDFNTENTMKKVQSLLTAFLACPTIEQKKAYLGRLPPEDFEILVRAYFQLVENTILAHSDVRH